MIFLKLLEPLGIDFRVYYESAWLLLHGGNPYYGILSTTFPLNYPPPFLLFIWPLGLFPREIAGPIWNILSVTAVLLTIFLTLRMISSRVYWQALISFAILFTIPFFPVKFNLGNGQINHILLLLVALSFYLYSRGRKSLSAVSLAIATSIKFAPVVFLIYFIAKGDRRFIVRYIGTLLVLFGLPIFLFGWDFQERYYFEIFFDSFTLGAKDWYYNQSIHGFIARAFNNPEIIYLLSYLGSAAIVILTWLRRKKLTDFAHISALYLSYLLAHPIALQHYFGFTIPPLIFLTHRALKNRGFSQILLLCLSYLLLAFDIKNFSTMPSEFEILLSHMFFGALLLWLLALFPKRIFAILFGVWTIGLLINYPLTNLCRAGLCY